MDKINHLYHYIKNFIQKKVIKKIGNQLKDLI